MKDDMIDLMAADVALRRRLETYADSALTPDLAASSRMRARVLAIAHRRADLDRRDRAALTVLAGGGTSSRPGSRSAARPPARATARHRRSRTASALLAASLGIAVLAGTAAAARPGGGLYETRLWAESMTLPADPSARSIAELARLTHRISEAREAAAAGDGPAAGAALAAYERIMEEATTAALSSGNPVAVAALEAGVAGNVVVLRELLSRIPPTASAAVGRALDRAIEHSTSSVEAIGTSIGRGGAGAAGSDGQGGGSDSQGTQGGNGSSGAGAGDQASPKPTKPPAATPTVRPAKPTATPTPQATPKPTPKSGVDDGQKPDATPRSSAPPHPG